MAGLKAIEAKVRNTGKRTLPVHFVLDGPGADRLELAVDPHLEPGNCVGHWNLEVEGQHLGPARHEDFLTNVGTLGVLGPTEPHPPITAVWAGAGTGPDDGRIVGRGRIEHLEPLERLVDRAEGRFRLHSGDIVRVSRQPRRYRVTLRTEA